MNIFKNVKLLLTLYKQWKKIKEVHMSAGIKSSGFIMTLFGSLVAVAMFFVGSMSPEITAIVVAVMVSTYTMARAFIVSSKKKTDDEKFNKIIAIMKPIADKLGIELKPIEIKGE